MSAAYKHQGTGTGLQKTLLQNWFQRLGAANQNKEPVVYLFISGNIAELLRPFGFHLVYPEVNALQCGIKKASLPFILEAEQASYSPDVCAYVKNDIGLVRKGNHAPFGNLPKPDLLLCNFSGCNTYIKWFEALSDHYDAPLFMLDVPYLRGSEGVRPQDRDYVRRQMDALIRLCEQISGVRWDEGKFRETVALSRRAEDRWAQILHSAKNKPSPFDSFFEAVFFMAPIYVLRGTQECADYYEAAWLEIEERMQHGIQAAGEERFRVVMEGPPPWPHFRKFGDMFKKWGVCNVASTYSKVGGIWDLGLRHDPEHPMDSVIDYAFNCYTNWDWGRRRGMIENYIRDYGADGLVIHSVKSCRSFSMGQADLRDHFVKRGVPTLLIESDLEDPRYFSAAQIQNRIDAFFESLDHQRLISGAAAPGARS